LKTEIRHFPIEELRVEEVEGKRVIAGYAAVFNKLSVDLGGFVERISKGAFQESIKSADVRALWSHNIDMPLGRTANKTLTLTEDEHGLLFKLELPDTNVGRDAFTSIKRGDVSGMSFGFRVPAGGSVWERGKESGPHTRTLLKIDLLEVSPTAFPAYPGTEVSTRDARSVLQEAEELWAKESPQHSTDSLRTRQLRAEAPII